jgi:enoyl-CoA hydratase
MLRKRIEGAVLVVELACGARGNALNGNLQRALAEVWETFDNEDSLRIAVLHGAPDVFSVGHDVEELAASPAELAVPDERFYPLQTSKPVIAALEGPCYGLGFELALACDLRVAGKGARFGFPDSNLFVPYRLASVLLPRMTFLGTCLELILSGRILGADEMQALGLVTELAEDGEAAARAIEIACDMNRRFTAVRNFRKHSILRLSGLPVAAAMQAARAVDQP